MTVKYVDIPLGRYMPDFGGMPNAAEPGYLTDAVNVRLTPNGYRGMPTFETFGGAPAVGTGTPVGAGHFSLISGTDWFQVTDNSVYQSRTLSSWGDNTPSSGAATQFSQFVQYDEFLVLVDINDISVKDLTASVATDFAALGGSPPNAAVGGRIRNHLVLGRLVGDNNSAVRWCAIGDIADWPTPGTSDARSKQAGREDLPQELGKVSAILGGEKYGVVAQEFGLTRMSYVGGSAVYDFDTFEKKYGAGSTGSADAASYPPFVRIGATQWIWVNEDGVFITDGYSVRNLSAGRIEAALFLNAISHPTGRIQRALRGVYDARRKLVIFKTDSGSGSDLHLCYSVDTDNFCFAQGTSYHSLFEGWASDTDLTPVIYSVGPDRVLRRNTGGAPTIALQTGFMEIDPGYQIQLQGAHLIGAGVPGSLALSYKTTSSLGSVSVAQTGYTALTAPSRGMKSVGRVTDQYISFRVAGTGSEGQLINGIRIYYERGAPST